MMKFETKIVTLLMCVALSLLSSCNKKLPDTPVQEQQVPVGFRAMSQAVWVKSDEEPKTTFPYSDFGVWGIARQTGVQSPYTLWTNDQLTKVSAPDGTQTSQPEGNVVFTPETAAYWIRDYDYTFLAVAPYNDAGFALSGITTKEAQANATPAIQNPLDYMTFTYDMSTKYNGIPANGSTPAVAPDYDFDLLGAVAKQLVETGGYSTSQPLMFWHLLSKICIKVNFVGASGTVDQIRLSNVVTKGNYVISLDDEDDFDKPLSVTCTPSTAAADMISSSSPLILDSDNQDLNTTTPQWTLHIIPQAVSGFDLYIDFTVGASTVTNFKVNLSAAGTAPYTYNGSYNWILNITPNGITFDVAIVPWVDDSTGDNDFDFE